MQINDVEIQECNTIKQILMNHPESRTIKQLKYIQLLFEKKVGYIQQLSNKIHKDNLIKLVNSLSIEEFPPYQVLFNQGETGRKMYIILQGEVGVLIKIREQEESPLQINLKRKKIRSFEDIIQTKYKNYVLVATKKQYEHFGEIAIEQRIPRTATVITKCTCVCAVLSFDSYQKLLKDLLEETVQMRQEIIAKLYPFNKLPDYALQQMLHNAEELVFQQSTLLYKRYQQVKEIYIIITGEVLLQGWVLVPTDEGQNFEEGKKKMKLINLGLMGKGTIIGDLELYYRTVLSKNTQFRISQATAYEESKLVKVSFNTFAQIMQQYFQQDILNQYLRDKYEQKLTNTPQLISKLNLSQFKSTAIINNTINVYNLISRRTASKRIMNMTKISPIIKINNSKQNCQERGQRAQSLMEFKIKEYQTHKKQNSISAIRRNTIRTEQSQEYYQSKQNNVSNMVRNLKNRVRVSKAFFQYFDNEYINLSSQLNLRINTEPKQ